MLVFGGKDSAGAARSDVWEFKRNGLVWEWTNQTPTGTSPSARYGHVAVADADNGRNRMLVFGGTDGTSNAARDIWAFDMAATATAWTKLKLLGTLQPPRLEGHTLVLDARERTSPSFGVGPRYILFGGRDSTSQLRNDVWLLWISTTGDTVQWQQVAVSGGPSARYRHVAAWDRSLNSSWTTGLERMIVSGGDAGSSSASSESWALKLDPSPVWSPLESGLSGIAGHSAIYNPGYKFAHAPERYNQASGQWTVMNAPQLQPIYPFMFLLPSGNLFWAGPNRQKTFPPPYKYPSYLLNTATNAWSLLPSNGDSGFDGGSAVMYRPGEIMKCGTEADVDEKSIVGLTKKIKIDAQDNVVGGDWVSVGLAPDTLLRRAYHTTTLLPTGDVLVTGGLASQGLESRGV